MHQPDTTSYYTELGIPSKADNDEIRAAYKKKVKESHPDKGGDPEKFKKLKEIYEVLTDPQMREIYDQFGEEGLKEEANMGGGGGGGYDPFDPMSAFLSGSSRAQKKVKRKCKTRLIEKMITLEDAYKGNSMTVDFSKRVLCKACNGTGSDNPAAVQSCPACNGKGVRMVMQRMGGMLLQSQEICPECQGQGNIIQCKCEECKGEKVSLTTSQLKLDIEKGTYDGYRFNFIDDGDELPECEPGDVIVDISIEPHKLFSRKGADLTYKKNISLLEALTGVSFVLTHLDGKKILVETEKGDIIKPGVLKTLKEYGMPFYNQVLKTGNLNIDFNIQFPKSLEDGDIQGLESVLPEKLNNKSDIEKKEDIEKYAMIDFMLEHENTHHSGGKKENRHDDDDDYEERPQQCVQQ